MNMNKMKHAFLVASLILALPTLLLANGNGDVTVKINGMWPMNPPPQIFIGCDLISLEIWIANDAPLYHLSIGLSFDNGGLPFEFITPNGSLPEGGTYVKEHGDAVGAFDLGGLMVDTTRLPDTLLLIGNASTKPLPRHGASVLCYSLRLHIPSGQMPHVFCVDNTVIPPNGIWMFDDGSEYAPGFEGNPNSSINNPDAPEACFVADIIPCAPPRFTVTPKAIENNSHCSDYTFAFQAQDSKCGKGTLRFTCSDGTINETTGAFKLTPNAGCGSTAVTVSVFNSACIADEFTFTVNWIDGPPNLTNCPTTTGHVKPYGLYEYPFAANDPDACDKVIFEVAPFMCDPAGEYMVDSTGKFGFIPLPVDSGHTYVFTMVAKGGCNLGVRCPFAIEVGAPICGDANGDGIADISDIVHLITYIFQGGLQPNPLLSGDINCDATVDISDAVYFITYIFSGGPSPCAGCF
jgi:hypothetical protein